MKVHVQVAALVSVMVWCCLHAVRGANILAVLPWEGRSHWIMHRELLVELARRGHNLTVMTPFHQPGDPWEVIRTHAPFVEGGKFDFVEYGSLSPFTQQTVVSGIGTEVCRRLMDNPGVRDLIDSRQRTYDLLIMEGFFHDCFLAFSHKYRAPTVLTCTFGGGSSWDNHPMGNPYPLAYLPEAGLAYSSSMSLFQKTYNALFSLAINLHRVLVYFPVMDEMVREHFGDPSMPPLVELQRNASLLLVNNHFSFDYPRPLAPNTVQVAGMHIRPPKALPKDQEDDSRKPTVVLTRLQRQYEAVRTGTAAVSRSRALAAGVAGAAVSDGAKFRREQEDLQEFMDAAAEGVIYFSMGSNVKSTDLSEEVRAVFLKTFARLRQKVLWKLEGDSLPNQPANLRISSWFPQSDLLAHRNMRLFITHGGMMSLLEALYAGVPLLGVPIFGDQVSNLLRARDSGYGLVLHLRNITQESFDWAVNELLTDPRYAENARRLSRLFHDRPEPPLETAVRSVESVLRHGGARHTRPAALHLGWHQHLLLDVAAFVLLSALSAAAGAVLAVRFLVRTFFRKSAVPASSKKKTAKKD
ncbi:UDP-glucosyltransferase 2-like [Schistocerca piceifrons]|uniref:UDP-glucosyltransferase 2-like n=1 Tax=Schistocerca piceifrons TaxID=274613 RepID=UPI001F5F3A39|nr:UDP-glucosyltransferase 2-like [Schistocerca piceifrons]